MRLVVDRVERLASAGRRTRRSAFTMSCRFCGVHRLDRRASYVVRAEIERRRVAVDVDDRKLRARHRMLRHDQRRPRLVLADGRRRKLGFAALGRPRTDLAGRLLLRDERRPASPSAQMQRPSDAAA